MNRYFYFHLVLLVLLIICTDSAPVNARTLTPQDVIELTWSSSPVGQAIRKNRDVADEKIRAILAQYDTQWALAFSHTDDKTKRASPIFGTATTSTVTTMELSQLLPSGTRLGFILGSTREKTDSAFFTNSTYYDQRAGVTLSQPLVNNGFGYGQRFGVLAVKQERDATNHQTEADLQDLTHTNLKIFWNWYFSSGVTEIEAEALTLAKRLYTTNRQKVLIGLAEEGDLFAYAANINIRQNEFLTAKSDTLLAGGELVAVLGITDENTTLAKGAESGLLAGNLTILTEKALKSNPELKALRLETKALATKISAAKNARLPKVDAQASVIMNGLDPAFDQALVDVGDVNPVWQAGLSASFPLQNRAAKSVLRQLEVLQTQKRLQEKALEIRINKLVKIGVQRISLAHERVGVTSQAIGNQQKKWADEIKKYDQGRSDTDMVLRYQNDYLMARLMHLRARVDLALARVEVQRMVGDLKPH